MARIGPREWWRRRRARRKRLADFELLCAYDPGAVIELEGGSRLLTASPLADEPDALAAQGLAPADCARVDGAWRHGGDVALLRVLAVAAAPGAARARVRRARGGMLELEVVVDTAAVGRVVLSRVARELEAAGLPRPEDAEERFRPLAREPRAGAQPAMRLVMRTP